MSFEHKASGKGFDLGLWRRVLSLVHDHRPTLLFALLLTILMAVAGPLIPMFIQKTVDEKVMELDLPGLLANSGLIFALMLGQTGIFYFQSYYTNWLGQLAIFRLRRHTFRHILHLRLRVFDRTPIGTMISRTVSDVETVADVFGEGLINISGDLLQIVTIIGFMLGYDWRLTLVALAVFPVLLLAAWIFKEATRKSFQDVRTQVSRLNAFLQEHITGMSVIQAFNRQRQEHLKFKKINAAHRDANVRAIFAYSVFFPVIEVLSAIAVAVIVWYGAGGILQGRIELGVLMAFILYINMLFRPIRQVADKFNTLQMGMVAAERIFKVLDMKEHIPDTGEKPLKKARGKVEFRNVWFAYEADKWILKDVSFVVEPGQTLAIVGHTGAGKTTIINLINRLYDIQKGEILLDDVPITQYPLESLRRCIAVVLQDVFLFSDTIANNIRLFDENISIEEIREAAKLAGSDEFINRLPGGYGYNVQERGATLSAGQRQLVSFLRALVSKPAVLILDEATASVDHESERLIQRATDVLLQGRTSIVIAHRLATILNAHQILVMDKGTVVERGTHEQLLKMGGSYARLYELQFVNAGTQ